MTPAEERYRRALARLQAARGGVPDPVAIARTETRYREAVADLAQEWHQQENYAK